MSREVMTTITNMCMVYKVNKIVIQVCVIKNKNMGECVHLFSAHSPMSYITETEDFGLHNPCT